MARTDDNVKLLVHLQEYLDPVVPLSELSAFLRGDEIRHPDRASTSHHGQSGEYDHRLVSRNPVVALIERRIQQGTADGPCEHIANTLDRAVNAKHSHRIALFVCDSSAHSRPHGEIRVGEESVKERKYDQWRKGFCQAPQG